MGKQDILQPVDEDFRKLAKTLLRTMRSGALACIESGTGFPLSSRISCTTRMDGAPVFLISWLAPHFAALEANDKCSILVGEPGKGDPLAHPRMTVFGRARMIEDSSERALIKKRFLGKLPKAELYVDFPDFAFWSLEIERASLNGGFGKACDLETSDLLVDMAGCEELIAYEASAVEHMNDDHMDAVQLYATKLMNQPEGKWRIASVDPEGMDLVDGDVVQRYWFDPVLSSVDDLRPRLVELAKKARGM